MRAFQQAQGLTVDGIAGPRTLEAIERQLPRAQEADIGAGIRGALGGLLDAARTGADAVREAAERIRESSPLGERWRQQMDEATRQASAPVVGQEQCRSDGEGR